MRRVRVLALLTMMLLCFRGTVAHADSPGLDQLATQLVGAPVTVECFAPGGFLAGYVIATASVEDGYVWHMQHVIHLTGDECGSLQNALQPTDRTLRWMHTWDGSGLVGQAFIHLLHEATHISLSSIDEGLVECTAYRNLWPSLRYLNLDWRARQLVYRGGENTHLQLPTKGKYAEYRSVC